MPPRYSTTTPTWRRSSPQIFSTSSASWRPSTYPAGQRGLGPTGRTHDRTRGSPGGQQPCSRRSLEHDRASLVREPRADGEAPPLPVPILQDHQTALPTQHHPAESRGDILQHQPDLKHEVRARRSALPVRREYVARVQAGRGHAESVGERRPWAGDLRAPARGGLPVPWQPCRCSHPARRCSPTGHSVDMGH